MMRSRRDEVKTAIICVLPALAVIGTFSIFPIFYTFYLSLTDWDGFSRVRSFVGLNNYIRLFSSASFWQSIKVTFYYAAGVTLLSVLGGLVLAAAINTAGRLMFLYRIVFFIPTVTSFVAAAVVWRSLFSPAGFLSDTFRSFGLSLNWLGSPILAMPALILVGAWMRLGFNTVIALAGLQSIPKAYYDRAKIEGAGTWHIFRFITLPLMKPMVLLLCVMSIVDAFLVFDLPYVMTGGGPVEATNVVGLLIYKNAFHYYKMGFASSIAISVFLIILLITLIQMKVFRFGKEA